MSDGALDLIQTLLIAATLWTAGIGLGMTAWVADIISSVRRPALVARIAVLDVVLVPVAMWIAVSVLLPDSGIGTGLLLVAFASAGPLGIKLADMAGGDVLFAIGIVVILELVNVAAIPIWSSLLGVADTTGAVVAMVRTLVLLVVLPIGVGMFVGRRSVTARQRWAPFLERLSNAGVVVVVGFVLVRNVGRLDERFASDALLAAGLVTVFALTAGWLIGGPHRPTCVSTSLVTGVRANAAAVAIATTSFAHMPAVSLGVVIAGLVSVVIPSLYAAALTLRSRRIVA